MLHFTPVPISIVAAPLSRFHWPYPYFYSTCCPAELEVSGANEFLPDSHVGGPIKELQQDRRLPDYPVEGVLEGNGRETRDRDPTFRQ